MNELNTSCLAGSGTLVQVDHVIHCLRISRSCCRRIRWFLPWFALVAIFADSLLWAQPEHPAPIKSEIQIEGGDSIGNFHLLAYAEDRRILPLGVEYDRHSFGHLFRANLDYVGELLPVFLMNEPAKYASNGKALTTERQIQYGAGVSPIGFRLLWRRPGQLQPYGNAKGGFLYFKNRVLSPEGTHLQFSAEFSLGVEKAINQRWGFRAGYSDFHVSNGNIGRHNPGIDFMYFNGALTYRFGK